MAEETVIKNPKDATIVEDPYGVVTRRSFLSWLTLGWAAFGSVVAISLGAFQRFLFPNVLREPPQQFIVLYLHFCTERVVDATYKGTYGVWLVKDRDPVTGKMGVFALSTICTHLGCTPNWLSGEEKFKCPCHGSGFKKTGMNFEGPAPRPLERYRVVLAEDGRIFVDKTKKFQFEKGQSSDPEAFLPT